jgi:hypothetical protein
VHERHRETAGAEHWNPAAPAALRRAAAEIEARLEAPAHPYAARDAFDAPHQLAQRCEPLPRERHRIENAHAAFAGRERGLEDVRVGQITPPNLEGRHGTQLEMPAALGVEERAQHARRIHLRETEPVDAAISRHQRDGAAVADEGIVADGGVTADAYGNTGERLHVSPLHWLESV